MTRRDPDRAPGTGGADRGLDPFALLTQVAADLAALAPDADPVMAAVTSLGTAGGPELVAELGLDADPRRLLAPDPAAGRSPSDPAGRLLRAVGRVVSAAQTRRVALTEWALRERCFHDLVELLPLSLFEIDADGRLTYMNRQGREMWGVAPERTGGTVAVVDMSSPANRGLVQAALDRVLQGDELRGLEIVSDRPEGRLVTELDVVPIRRGGEVVGLRGAAINVTARRATEDALRASERRFRELVELLPLAVIETDGRARITFANRHFHEMTGFSRSDVEAGLSLPQILDATDQLRVQAAYRSDPSALGRLRGEEYLGRRPDGSTYAVAVYSSQILSAGQVVGVRGIAVDISRRKEAEAALRESERRFRELTDLLPQPVFEIDPAGRLTYLNRAGLSDLGYSAAELAAGLHLAAIVPPEGEEATRGRLAQLLAGESLRGAEVEVLRRDGARRRFAVSASPITRDGEVVGGRGVAVDVTEQRHEEEARRQLEAKLQQAQKLESLGVLAGGIAHDFNNLLVGVLGNTELALAELAAQSPLAARLRRVKAAAERAADLTNQLLAYAGKGRFQVRDVDLSAAVEEMAHLVRSAVGRHGILVFDLDRSLPPVEADATQIRQVAMNLVINASDSLHEGPGVITVRTGVVAVNPTRLDDAWCADDMAPGLYVFLEVEDSGLGMDAETRARIFDPFFTTKFAGRGLGLAAVLGIVRAHHGAIQVQSTPGHGSRFRVLLPALEGGAEVVPVPPRSGVSGWRGHGTILVIDDEEEVREVAATVLRGAGFQVHCAADGREGMSALRRHRGEIVAVLLDMTMPHLGGEATLRELRELAPELPVVMVSGYSEEELLRRVAGLGVAGALQKPFDIESLLTKVRGALETAPPAAVDQEPGAPAAE